LGNLLDTLGRFIEPCVCWTAALAVDPDFWMAPAKPGTCADVLCRRSLRSGASVVSAYHAHHDLTQAVELINRHPYLGDARLERIFAASAADIARRFDLAAIAETHRPAEGSLGRSKTEHTYRRWCLMNVYGEISYLDVFGLRHTQTYRLMHGGDEPAPPGALKPCGDGNEGN